MKITKKFTLKIIIISIFIFVIIFGVYFYLNNRKAQETSGKFVEFTVQRKNLSVVISGTGTVKSSYSQDILSKVSSTVKKVYFKEGDKVKVGDLMFELDDEPVKKQIERTELSIEQTQNELSKIKKSIADLIVKAPISGQIVGLMVKEGDNVNKGAEICSVVDTSRLKLIVPFNKSQISKFYIGQEADVYLQDYMQVVKGKISYISTAGKVVGGGATYDVEIIFNNPGTIKSGTKASAVIGNQTSLDNSTVEYFDTKKVRAESNGTIEKIFIRENERVFKGQTIVKLVNDDLDSQLISTEMKLRDLNIQLESQIEEQNNYKIFAPGNGIIIKQNIKVGDVVKPSDVLSTIIDNEKMEFEIPIDELDIAKIHIGLEASVTIDALPEMRFKGVVSKVANEGTSQNGVTTYPVTIEIQNPEKIKIGMNANADIIVQQKENVLTLPLSAVQKMGNRTFVFVRKKAGEDVENDINTRIQNRTDNNRINTRMQVMIKNLGPDVGIKRINVGINNDTDIEIVDGLNEGDIVLVPISSTSNTINTRNQQFMPFGVGSGFGGMGGTGGFQRNWSDSSRRESNSGGGQRGNN